MIWGVRWGARADEVMRRLAQRDRSTARRIGSAVTRLAETRQGDVKKLAGREDEWRLRVGDWRVILSFDEAAEVIVVLRVARRGDVYRD